jgi:hypothetical protein
LLTLRFYRRCLNERHGKDDETGPAASIQNVKATGRNGG